MNKNTKQLIEHDYVNKIIARGKGIVTIFRFEVNTIILILSIIIACIKLDVWTWLLGVLIISENLGLAYEYEDALAKMMLYYNKHSGNIALIKELSRASKLLSIEIIIIFITALVTLALHTIGVLRQNILFTLLMSNGFGWALFELHKILLMDTQK